MMRHAYNRIHATKFTHVYKAPDISAEITELAKIVRRLKTPSGIVALSFS